MPSEKKSSREGGKHRLDQREHTPVYQNEQKEMKKHLMETTLPLP